MNSTDVSIGIDISKKHLDTCVLPSGEKARFANSSEGMASLVAWLEEHRPGRIVCEPSGGQERLLVCTLQKAGLPLAMVNARQIRDFARARGILAKTDHLDALVLADYGITMRPPLTAAHPCAELSLYVARRRQLVDMLRRERQHRATAASDAVKADIAGHIAELESRLRLCEQHIHSLITADTELARKQTVLTSCKGIGDRTAAALLVELPELGSLPHGKIAALAGLAPFNHDSGSLRGTRHIRGGRSEVRIALYMATLTAARTNPDIKALYKRLIASGKHAKVALTACARKLLLTLNSMLRDNRTWTAEYVTVAGEKQTKSPFVNIPGVSGAEPPPLGLLKNTVASG